MEDNSKNNLLISVITASFNRSDFLEKNILSIKNQDYPFIEHIIIDGGSTDNSLDLIKKYEGTYNMKWISEKDKGAPDAINKGLAMAKGDIVCWLDSDDEYMPGILKKVAEIFYQKPEIGVVFGNLLVIDGSGKIIDSVKRVEFDRETAVYLGTDLAPQSTFYRRLVRERIGFMDIKYKCRPDYEFFLKMAMSGEKFYFLREFLAKNRIHGNQLTSDFATLERERKEIFEKYVGNKVTAFYLARKRFKIYGKRIFKYLIQGDFVYIIHRFVEHIKNSIAVKKLKL